MRDMNTKIAVFTVLFFLIVSSLFSEELDRNMIPDELLRPRREESPRYPIDTVIGELGRGTAPTDAYALARNIASAMVAGSIDAPVLSTVNRVFLEDYMSLLDEINPRMFRLGSGRTEPDGSVSFLVRFVGRDYGITGELYVRLVERRPVTAVVETEATVVEEEPQEMPLLQAALEEILGFSADTPMTTELVQDADQIITELTPVDQTIPDLTPVDQTPEEPVPQEPIPVELIWVFEDLVLEEVRSREEENRDSRLRFDFPPYERFF